MRVQHNINVHTSECEYSQLQNHGSSFHHLQHPQTFLLLFWFPPCSFMYSPRVQGTPLIGELGTSPLEHIRERKSRLQFIPSPSAPFLKTSRWESWSVNPTTWTLVVVLWNPLRFCLKRAKFSCIYAKKWSSYRLTKELQKITNCKEGSWYTLWFRHECFARWCTCFHCCLWLVLGNQFWIFFICTIEPSTSPYLGMNNATRTQYVYTRHKLDCLLSRTHVQGVKWSACTSIVVRHNCCFRVHENLQIWRYI